MRRLIADVYKIVFRLTGHKVFALFFALGYVSALHIVTIYGCTILLEGWQPELSAVIFKLFHLPYLALLFVVMCMIHFMFVLPLQCLPRTKSRYKLTAPVIVYSLVTLVLVLYSFLFMPLS